MKKTLIALLVISIAGCAYLRTAKGDYDLGKNTPVREGEVAPVEAAKNDAEPVKSLPYGNVIYPVLAAVLGAWYTKRRGTRIRLGKEAKPVATPWLQPLADIFKGLFEVGPDNSGFKRGWKVLLSTGIALATTATTIPQVKLFLESNPQAAAIFVFLAAGLAGVEKELSKVSDGTANSSTNPSP